jgi:hypothetical protein
MSWFIFYLSLLELDVDVPLNRYLKDKNKTEKAFSPIDCAIKVTFSKKATKIDEIFKVDLSK